MEQNVENYEKLGAFYLGRGWDVTNHRVSDDLVLYDARDLTTHAVCVGMTGSGKTGLCIDLIEEAAIDAVPALVIDPKGDLTNLMLQFPELAPADFEPWVDPEAARRQGLTVSDYARSEAARWSKGLAEWGQDGERIRRLRQAAEFAVYTPGSHAGRSVSILRSFAAPGPAFRDETDLVRERAASTVTGLLGLLGIDADPLQSREHILLTTILLEAWNRGADVDLGGLIQAIQTPPVTRLGVLELEAFYPQKERFQLAMALNNLLAAPGFHSWLEGEPLDPGQLLYGANGAPRVAIFSIAHLGDAERMFFVTLLLEQTLGWMRSQPGTGSLRAILYMDEIFGYFPPTRNPPSKQPLLTLLKQARAFGLGVVLATQNPVDLDYKGLANAGTWFIGKLQTERDRARLLEGLQAAGGAMDRSRLETILDGLGSRVFLLHDVHAPAPRVFQTRWTLSYLRGPMTREEIKRLTSALPAPATAAVSPPQAAVPMPEPRTRAAMPGTAPLLPPDVPSTYLSVRAARPGNAALLFVPQLLGRGTLRFVDPKTGIDVQRNINVLSRVPATPGAAAWVEAQALQGEPEGSDAKPDAAGAFASLPAEAAQAKSYARWSRQFADWLYRNQQVQTFRCADPKVASAPGESERDFRIRLRELVRVRRDQQVEALRAKYAPKLAQLQAQVGRAEQARARESEELQQQKVQSAISVGATILGAFLGGGRRSAVGRATTAARGFGRAQKQAADVERAGQNLESVQERLADLDTQFQREVAALDAGFDPQTVRLESVSIRPKKADIAVRSVELAWTPVWQSEDGSTTNAWE